MPEVKYTQKSAILGEFQVKVHSSLMSERLREAFSRLQQKAALPGFRPGKAPLEMIKKKYREDVYQDVFQKVVSETYRKAATENKVPVAGDPYITKTNFNEWEEGKSLEFTAEVDLLPEVKVKKYLGLPITKKEATIKDEDVEIVLKNLLDSKAELVNLPPETKVKKGHQVVIDFEGRLDGELLPDASAKNFFLEVGQAGSLEDFQNGLIGMKAGEEKTIEVKYPADYKTQDVAGKTVLYTVKLHEVKQKNYPELTDELAKDFQAGSAKELKDRILKSLEEEMAAEQKSQTQEEILLAFLEANPLEVPPSLINRQLQFIFQETAMMLKRQNFTDKVIEDYFRKHIKDFSARAEREVKLALLLPKVVEMEKIEAAEADFKAHFDEIVKGSGQNLEQIEKFFEEHKHRKEDLGREIQRKKALKLMIDSAKAK